MLSYVHAYHAGNFADVLKHMVLVQVLMHLKQKQKPIRYVETHAGVGVYSLKAQGNVLNKEYRDGIGRLWPNRLLIEGEGDELPMALRHYLDVVAQFNGSKSLSHYPGSPGIAYYLLGNKDEMFCTELHPAAFRQLSLAAKEKFHLNASSPPLIGAQAYPRCHVVRSDGYIYLKASLPPSSGRACVMIDPSYEVKTEYQQVLAALTDAYTRFKSGVYLLWYPVVDREVIKKMRNALIASGMRRISCVELCVAKDTFGRGMTGSGMFIVNAPWTLADNLKASVEYLCQQLAQESACTSRLEILVGE